MADVPDYKAPPVYIINLPRDEKRRDVMSARLDKTGLHYEFIEAVDGRALPQDEIAHYDRSKRLRYFGRDLLPGEIGCLLSHRKIFAKMDEENVPFAVILEDDVIFEDDFPVVLAALMQESARWDVIRFLGSEKIYKRGCRKIKTLTGDYKLARLPTAPGGAHGYLLSLKAARRMLRFMEKSWVPIDTLQGRCWETGLETLVVHPAPLYPDAAAGTTIGDERFDKTPKVTGLMRLLLPVFRAKYKIGEAIGKKYIYFSSWFRDMRAGRI